MSDDAPIVRTVRVEHESGAWAEIKANRSRAYGQALALNRYWRDLAPVLAPLIRDWGRSGGPMTVEVAEMVEGAPVLAEDGTTELLPERAVYQVIEKALPPPCEDARSILTLSEAEPDLANWLHTQAILAPKTLIDNEAKQPGRPSSDTPDGTPGEATPAITPMGNHRSRRSSTKQEASISA